MQKSIQKYFALFALPGLICFAIAFLIPMVMGVVLSFFKFTTVTDGTFIGIDNYKRIFINNDFTSALWFTVKFTVVSVITINLGAFTLAMLLTRGIKGTNAFRTIFFMPNLIGGIVLGWIWQVIINGVLLPRGVTIVSDPKYGFWGLVVLMNWQNIGYMMVIYIAGIQNISHDLIEAAQIDGANKVTMLRSVILPSIMPSITICSFLTLTNGFKLFDQNLALTAGDPGKQTEMLALNIFNTFYGRSGFEGVGQAKAVIFTIIVAFIALTQLRLTRSKEVEA
ncbi:carbohydrate ABC transporter membrane protein 1, CUT1 family [Sphaerochaeta associata]|uniref:Sugar ABC transporter permease n=1 Tax=Sphaerochaeta associata TaxID=1129264 RepID=A0ABY4D5I9_9SPIR|nr:sugar ABC transporter permease [Sphaerochaeta associata]UOM49562.1 sugar ABC transporter permease [Sphaerochaeta associata]SMP55020.1 carbohydrate ABC transporter membrane protein 1, CUT1 family [Sphaerochaeta associata]